MKTNSPLVWLALLGVAQVATAAPDARQPQIQSFGHAQATASKPQPTQAMPARDLNVMTATLGADGKITVQCHDEINPETAAAIDARRAPNQER